MCWRLRVLVVVRTIDVVTEVLVLLVDNSGEENDELDNIVDDVDEGVESLSTELDWTVVVVVVGTVEVVVDEGLQVAQQLTFADVLEQSLIVQPATLSPYSHPTTINPPIQPRHCTINQSINLDF